MGEGQEIPLTPREMEVLRCLAEARTNKEISEQLGIAVGTVSKHCSNIYAKLGVAGRTEAVMRALSLGTITEAALR